MIAISFAKDRLFCNVVWKQLSTSPCAVQGLLGRVLTAQKFSLEEVTSCATDIFLHGVTWNVETPTVSLSLLLLLEFRSWSGWASLH